MSYLITVHNELGITLSSAIYSKAPAHLPTINDTVEFADEDGHWQKAVVKRRTFRLVPNAEIQEVILRVAYEVPQHQRSQGFQREVK